MVRFWRFFVERFDECVGFLVDVFCPTATLVVRVGMLYMSVSSLRAAGEENDYWSSTAHLERTVTYDLILRKYGIFPSDAGTRWFGFTDQSLKRTNLGEIYCRTVKPYQRWLLFEGKMSAR